MQISLVNLNLIAQDAIGQCLLNQTRFFRRRGDEVRIYTMHPPQDVPEDATALTRVVGLADLIAGRCEHFTRSDLYVYHYPGRYPLVESIKGLDRGAVIFYYHNVTPPELWKSDFEREALQHSRESAGPLAHYADLIVTPSPFNAEQLVEEHACERDRIHVLPLAVLLGDFSPGPRDSSLLRQYGLEGRQVILFVGRMAGNKRIDLLVEALPMVQREVPNAMLLLVGDNQSNPAIQETVVHSRTLAAELGVDDDVVFTGVVDELPPYYRLADVYATASLHEGFGVPLIEAMASGVPVVASRAAAHPWVVDEAGLLVEPNDAAGLSDKIVRVLTDDGLCGELVRRGLARAREFSLEHYEAEWARIVTEATAWLPDQPYPRLRSLPAQQVVTDTEAEAKEQAPTVQEILFNGELGQLKAVADVMIHDYEVRSRMPVIGPLVSWLRRNLTSHLRGPYIDPTFRRQVAFNNRVIEWMIQATDFWAAFAKQLAEQRDRIEALELQVEALTRRLDERDSS
jgi:glycosyltransferase involved in cell wall biosynthesis